MTTLREGSWRGHTLPPMGHDPEGKTLGILGMGGIGRNLKKKAEAFGIKVIYHNRNKLSKPLAAGADYVSFDDLLSTSDVISINIPLNVSHSCEFRLSDAVRANGSKEEYSAYDLHPGIRKDERRCRPSKHRTWGRS